LCHTQTKRAKKKTTTKRNETKQPSNLREDPSARRLLLFLVSQQDDQQANEDVHEIQEQRQSVPDIVPVPARSLFHDELRIEDHEAAEDEQAEVQLEDEEVFRTEEEIEEAQPQQSAERRAQESAQEEIRSALRVQSGDREAGEHTNRAAERHRDEAGINLDRQSDEIADGAALQKADAEKIEETLHLGVFVVGGKSQGDD